MLIEIPDLEVILAVIISFVVGLVGLYGYFKIHPLIKNRSDGIDSAERERLEYYERQLIDMKIRLDSIELQENESKTESNKELNQFFEKFVKNPPIEKPEPPKKTEVDKSESVPIQRMPNLDHNNATDYVLQLITSKAMTSRDIQITLKRSREHTSRLMKKLFDDGFVNRNTKSKPYTYSISEKGRGKIKSISSNLITV